jgi:hypothetical protein
MAASIILSRCGTFARDEGGAGGDRLLHGIDRTIHRAPNIRLRFETHGGSRRGLLFGQAIDVVVHHHVTHLHVLAGGVVEVIAADGKGIAVAAEDENVQIRPGE